MHASRRWNLYRMHEVAGHPRFFAANIATERTKGNFRAEGALSSNGRILISLLQYTIVVDIVNVLWVCRRRRRENVTTGKLKRGR